MIPLKYNAGNLRSRGMSVAMTVFGIAVVIGVTIAMMALYNGVRTQLIASGSPDLLLVMEDGVDAELSSRVTEEQFDVIRALPGIAKDSQGTPLVAQQVVSIFKLTRKDTGKKSGITMRGVSGNIFALRPDVRIVEGRMFTPGVNEVIVSRRLHDRFAGMNVGGTFQLGPRAWNIVGVFDAGGTAFDSELWSDVTVLEQFRKRDFFSSLLIKPVDRNALDAIAQTVRNDPRLKLQAHSEREYYARQTQGLKSIRKLVAIVTFFMAGAAIFGTMNTMFSAIASRGRELATLRALGFRRREILLSILLESASLSLLGGIAGVLLALPVNLISTGTFNGMTMSEVAFSFRVDRVVAAIGIAIALGAGIVGGVLPAINAALMPITKALREI